MNAQAEASASAPQAQAAAIIAHYLRQLTQASGRRWTPANDHDMQRLAELLADDQAETIAPYYQPALDAPAGSTSSPQAEPPRQLDTRVTTVLDKPASRQSASADDLNDPNFQRWRQLRRGEDDQTRRLVQREPRR
jgi:hypothetical protein